VPKALLLFLIFLVTSQTFAQKKLQFFVPTISIKMSLSGDMSNSYQVSGPLGSSLKGEPEKADGACENNSTFNQVIYRSKKSLQVWMTLKCSVSGQTFIFKPQRFFIDLQKPDQIVSLPAQSESFKKIEIQLSDIQIKDSQKPKK
jgi:hypothetical protein